MKIPKLSFTTIFIAVALVIAFLCGGGPFAPHKIDGTIIGVMPQHATRIEIIYKDPSGKMMQKSIHQSETVTDGKIIVDPHDYLSGYCKKQCKEYYLTIDI